MGVESDLASPPLILTQISVMATRTSPRIASMTRLSPIAEEKLESAPAAPPKKLLRPAGSAARARSAEVAPVALPESSSAPKRTGNVRVEKRKRTAPGEPLPPCDKVFVCPCPTFVCPTVSEDVIVLNEQWDAKRWDASCKRGLDPKKTEGLCFDLMKELRNVAATEGLYELGVDKYSPLAVASLNSEQADEILFNLWNNEFNQKSITNLWLALAPKQPLDLSVADGALDRMTKTQVIKLLVKHKVPFVEFDTFEDLTSRSRDGTYKPKRTVRASMWSMLETYVFSSEDEFTHGMDQVDEEEDVPEPQTRLNKSTKLRVELSKPPPSRTTPNQRPATPPVDPDADTEFWESGSMDSKHSGNVPAPNAKDAMISRLRAELARKQALADSPVQALSKKAQEKDSLQDKEIAALRDQIKRVKPTEAKQPAGLKEGTSATDEAEFARSMHTAFCKIGDALAVLSEDKKSTSSSGKTSLPYDRKILQLDLAVRDGKYINFASFGVKALRALEMRATSKGQKVQLVGKSLQMVDELDESQGDEGMAEWYQGLRFTASRILTEGFFGAEQDMLVSLDRSQFAEYVQHDFVLADQAAKLKTVNEFVRRMCSLKKPLWMPEVAQHQILFVQAMTTAARGNRFTQAEADDRPAPRGRTLRRNKQKERRLSAPAGMPRKTIKLTLEARKKNGVCPSRKTKSGVCPQADDPASCKQSHECPRCPGMFHAAGNCSKCRA